MFLKTRHKSCIFVLLLVYSCSNAPKNIPFPQAGPPFIQPVIKPLVFQRAVPLIPVVFTGERLQPPAERKMADPENRILADFEKKAFPPDTLPLPVPQQKTFFRNMSKSVPFTLNAGEPLKVNSIPASVRDNVMTGIAYYNQENGLPGNVAQSVITDRYGRLWIGTEGGLCMFDGHTWEVYTTAQGLSSNNITAVMEDRKGNIWAGTSGGGLNMLQSDGKIIRQWTTLQGLSHTIVNSLVQDREGNIWAGTYGGGINIINEAQNSLEHLEKKQGLSNDHVWTLFNDSKGNIWVGTHGGGVNIVNRKNNTVEQYESLNGPVSGAVFAITEDRNGIVWTGTNGGGIYGFLPGRKQQLYYSVPHGLGSADVFSLCSDSKNDLWVGTYRSGITVIKPGGEFRYLGPAQGLSSATVTCLHEDNRGNMWACTNGGGIDVIRAGSGIFKHFNVNHGLSDNYAYALFESRDGRLWVGNNGGGPNAIDRHSDSIRVYRDAVFFTVQGGIYEDRNGSMWFSNYTQVINELDTNGTVKLYNKNQGVIQGNTWGITGDSKGNIWSVSIGTGITVINKGRDTVLNINAASGLSTDNVNLVKEDADGNIWIGTNGSGINVIDAACKTVRAIGRKEGLSGDNILCLYEDAHRNMWIGSDGGGVDVITADRHHIFHLGVKEGLPNDRVQSIVSSKEGLWLGTGYGLACVQPIGSDQSKPAFRILNFDKSDGLKSLDFIANSGLCAADGTLFWGVGDGVTSFVPEKMEDTMAPVTYITGVSVMKHPLSWQLEQDTGKSYTVQNGIVFKSTSGPYHLPGQLQVPYSQNYLSFSFTGIAFGQEKNIRYRYLLDGFDDTWSEPTADSRADYRNIPPGRYVFQVSACNRSGYWSKPVSFSFEVKSPWWRNGGAYLGYAAIFFSIIFGFNGIRTRSLRNRQKQLEQTVKERTAEIAEKQQEIIDSIQYAATIQQALLASEEQIGQYLEHFILYLPKDIVAGDFYWFHSIDRNKMIFMVADCTGHGVPGAFMSLMGVNFLNEIVTERGVSSPAAILNELRKGIIRSFESGTSSGRRDGMDASLIRLDLLQNILVFSGANNPLWILRNGEILEFAAQKMPVGRYHGEEKPFTETTVNLQKGDLIYLFTDGFADQFGLPANTRAEAEKTIHHPKSTTEEINSAKAALTKGKKFKYSSLKKVLADNGSLPLKAQKKKLETILGEWKGNLEQVDDVCIIGIKI